MRNLLLTRGHFITGEKERLYFAVNSAKEIVVEQGDFQLLNGSMYPEILLRTQGDAKYQLQFFGYTGELLNEMRNISLHEVLRIPESVMLIKGKCLE